MSLVKIKRKQQNTIKILDCGAGYGMLTLTTVKRLLKEDFDTIDVTLYEIDKLVIPRLKKTIEKLKKEIELYKNVKFKYNIITEDSVTSRPDLTIQEKFDEESV